MLSNAPNPLGARYVAVALRVAATKNDDGHSIVEAAKAWLGQLIYNPSLDTIVTPNQLIAMASLMVTVLYSNVSVISIARSCDEAQAFLAARTPRGLLTLEPANTNDATQVFKLVPSEISYSPLHICRVVHGVFLSSTFGSLTCVAEFNTRYAPMVPPSGSTLAPPIEF
ncbi:hypothetical protein C8R44DRAFT_749292 [Mycena epipterygia]|nr:hypothetical protein C8R44DRAFT_749292 [Mycena epipterygia]